MSSVSISDITTQQTRLQDDLVACKLLAKHQKQHIAKSWLRQAKDYGINCKCKYELMLKEALAPYENYKSFYDLQDKNVVNITERILNSPSNITPESTKNLIRKSGREFYTIKYQSDKQDLKCMLSFPKLQQNNPDLTSTIFLRGGGDLYGLPHPAIRANYWKENNIFVLPLGRGWETEAGKSDFGGPVDMADKMNLIKDLPKMYKTLQLAAKVDQFILAGGSNGGNYAVRLLENYADELKDRVTHLILLSGALNYPGTFDTRPDCYEFWKEEFNLSLKRTDNNYPKWVWERDILKTELIEKINKKIPILMIEVLDDNCAQLFNEGLPFMEEALKANLMLHYWVAEWGGHCAGDNPQVGENIGQWLADTTYIPNQFDAQRIAKLSYEELFWRFSGSPGQIEAKPNHGFKREVNHGLHTDIK